MGKLRLHTGAPQDKNRVKPISSKSTKWRHRFYLSLGINSLLVLLGIFRFMGLI